GAGQQPEPQPDDGQHDHQPGELAEDERTGVRLERVPSPDEPVGRLRRGRERGVAAGARVRWRATKPTGSTLRWRATKPTGWTRRRRATKPTGWPLRRRAESAGRLVRRAAVPTGRRARGWRRHDRPRRRTNRRRARRRTSGAAARLPQVPWQRWGC